MSGLVWLASYPKSGNTWFRMMLSALGSGRPAQINDLAASGGHAADREMFDGLTQLESGLLTDPEIDALRPAVYAAVAQGGYPKAISIAGISFLKVHDAYRAGPGGRPLFAAGSRAILIVRDPRDVAAALANAAGWQIDQAIEAMLDEAYSVNLQRDGQAPQFAQRLSSWDRHAETWLSQSEMPVLVLRYEDMKRDAAEALARAAAFVGAPIDAGAARAAAANADFGAAQSQEQAAGFVERSPEAAGLFFRRGEVGGWRGELSEAQARRLELRHGRMMRKLGYAPAYATDVTV